MKKAFIYALLFEIAAIAYDATIITAEDLKILKEFDKRYYSLRSTETKRQKVQETIDWCWQNMRTESEAGAFDINAYTEIQSQTYYAPASVVHGAGITYRPNDQSVIRVSKDSLGRTRIDALLNLSILDNAEAKREQQRILQDKRQIAELVAEIAKLLTELRYLDIEDEAAHLEEVRLKARAKSGIIAEDNRLEHLAKNTERYKQIAKKEVELKQKQSELELYIRGDKIKELYNVLDKNL